MVKWFLVISNNNTYFTFMVRIPILSTSVTPTEIIITFFFCPCDSRQGLERVYQERHETQVLDQPLGPASEGDVLVYPLVI